MSFLPADTYLGKLEIIEVYAYYDRPVLFACRSATDTIYLAVLEDEDTASETWLYVAVSRNRFNEIRSGAIDLYRAFKQAEDNFVLQVTLFPDGEHTSDIATLSVENLTEDQLPEQGEVLNLETATLEANTLSIERRAAQTNREALDVDLHFTDRRRTDAPILVLSELLRYIQESLIAIGHTISPLYRDSREPTRDLRQEMEVSLVDVSAGSFKLELASSRTADMFGYTLLADAIEELAKIVEVGADGQQLEQLFSSYKRSVPKHYVSLLNAIKSSGVDRTELRWAAPQGDRKGEIVLLSPTVFATIETIQGMVVHETRIFSVTGTLTGTYVERSFEISSATDVYRGQIDTHQISIDDFDLISHAQIQKRYIATLREESTRYIATDETRLRYFLIGFSEEEN